MTDEPALTGRVRLAASVIVGEDDILFHRDHQAVEQVSGQLPLTSAELATWIRVVEARAAWCAARNIVFRFLIVPEKHVIYADKLPGVMISQNRPAVQLMCGLSAETRLRCLYPVDALIAARQRFPTYYQTDTHWTERGAFVAYRETMNSIRREIAFDPITEDMVRLVERRQAGDLGMRLEPERDEAAISLWHKEFWPWRRVFENHGRSRGSTLLFESDRNTAPRLIVFRDSFFNYFVPHIISIFAKSVIVSSINMHFDLAEAVQPDIILFEIAERFLGNFLNPGERVMPEDRADLPFEEFSGVPLGTLAG